MAFCTEVIFGLVEGEDVQQAQMLMKEMVVQVEKVVVAVVM